MMRGTFVGIQNIERGTMIIDYEILSEVNYHTHPYTFK